MLDKLLKIFLNQAVAIPKILVDWQQLFLNITIYNNNLTINYI